MVFEGMSRTERRLAKKHAKVLQQRRPLNMTPLANEQWPKDWNPAPLQAWQSRKFHAQLHPEPRVHGREVMRLSVGRCTLETSGRWEGDITWDELMQVKREVGFGDWYAVEVYPRDYDLVDVANLRHLWIFGQPLDIGWFPSQNAKAAP